MRVLLVLTMLWLSLAGGVFAQPPEAAPRSGADQNASTTSRVSVPEPSEKALAYHRSGNVLWVINTIWGLVIPACFSRRAFRRASEHGHVRSEGNGSSSSVSTSSFSASSTS
jgi:hypothetical protein